ncbi:MAG: metal-dependent hydrolase, partial [Niameybacter sp.]
RRFGHRKATHSLLAVVSLMGLMYVLFGKNYIGLGVGLGYLSHLLLDMLNPRGVPLLYPFTKYKYKILGKIHTGEKGEEIVYFILMVGLLILAIKALSLSPLLDHWGF